MKHRLFLVLILMTALAAGAGAEALTDSEMSLYNNVYRGVDEWFFNSSGTVGLDFVSPRNPQVQGQTQLEFYPLDLTGQYASAVSALNVKKAFIRARFPGFKLTLGKTRLAWGQGSAFNAGDILFGSLNPVMDLTQSELRSDTAWLTAVNIPLGNFAFVETVVLPPALNTEAESPATIEKSSAGGRIYFLAGGVKIEGGYLYKGETKVNGDAAGHRPYLSLQGNIGPDWYLSSSLAIPTDEQKADLGDSDWEESWNLSFGLFHLQQINREQSLSMRLEALLFPYQNWDEMDARETIYGIYLYPELVWSASDSLNFSLRSVFSPVDASAMVSCGAGWNIYQGLTLMSYLSFMAGDEYDTFAWDRGESFDPLSDGANGLAFTTGLQYKF